MKNVAVIGLGNISSRHRKNIRELLPDAKIIAVPSRMKRGNETVENSDIVVNNIDDLLDFHIDFAVVASPATFHFPHSERLLKKGIPVLVEKPISADVKSAHQLASLCETIKAPVAVGYCLRYLESAKEMKKIMSNQYCGELHSVAIEVGQFLPTWRQSVDFKQSVSAQKHLGGGVLNELSHEIDYAHWIFGDLNARYCSMSSSSELSIEVEDQANIVATTPNKTEITLKLDFLQKSPTRFCKVVGSNCTIVWELIEDRIYRLDQNGAKQIFEGGGHSNANSKYLEMFKDFFALIAGEPNDCIRPPAAVKTVNFIDNCRDLAKKWN